METLEFSIDLIDKIKFESTEIFEIDAVSKEKSFYFLTKSDMNGIPANSTDEDLINLRIKLSELFSTKFSGYPMLEQKCDIKRDTFQKILRFKTGRNMTTHMLAKFAVGAELSIEEANGLFELLGHPLNSRNRFDYILMCELKNKCDITEFDSDLRKYGYKSIFSKAD